jgi:hypothetical protein
MERFTRPLIWLTLGMMITLILTACASATPEATSTPVGAILSDDFSASHPDWALFDVEAGAAYIRNKELHLEDRGKGIAIYSPLLDHTYEDIKISVETRYVQGAMNNWMGVICRQQDEANYYLLAISTDGYYLIQLVEDGTVTPLTGPTPSTAIHTGKAQNLLEATCKENTLTLVVNHIRLASRTDSTLGAAGQVALFTDAADPGGTTVAAFDDFILTQP